MSTENDSFLWDFWALQGFRCDFWSMKLRIGLVGNFSLRWLVSFCDLAMAVRMVHCGRRFFSYVVPGIYFFYLCIYFTLLDGVSCNFISALGALQCSFSGYRIACPCSLSQVEWLILATEPGIGGWSPLVVLAAPSTKRSGQNFEKNRLSTNWSGRVLRMSGRRGTFGYFVILQSDS